MWSFAHGYYLNSNEVTIGKRQYGIEIADNPVVSKHHATQSGGAIVLIVFFLQEESVAYQYPF